MRTFRSLLWLSVFGLVPAGCTSPAFIAMAPDGGRTNEDGSSATDGSGGASDGGGTYDASSDGGQSGGTCLTSADCASGEECGFAETGACGNVGQCFSVPAVHCELYSAGCACDGSEINVACTGLPNGYSTKPLLYNGACADAGQPDGGDGGACVSFQGGHCGGNTAHPCTCASPLVCTGGPLSGDVGGTCEAPDSGGPCVTNADCPSSEVCGYDVDLGCSAKGLCLLVPTMPQVCDPLIVCACDGTQAATLCNVAANYASKPVLSKGPCAADGG
jgi:hypothetical protein